MANGNFAGGFAKGFTSSFEIGSRARTRREEQTRRDEAMKAQQQQIGRDLAGQRTKARSTEFTNLGVRLGSDPALAATLESGNFEELPAGVRDMLAPHIQGQIKDVMLANPGLAPEAAQQQVMFELRNALFLPAAETRRKTQEAAAITAANESETIEPVGGTAAGGQRFIKGGREEVFNVPVSPDIGQTINLVNNKTGEEITVRRDTAAATALVNAGFVEVSPAAVTGTREEVFPGTKSQRGKAAAAAVGAAGDVAATANVLREIEAAGRGAVGIRAILGNTVGGFAGQINKSLGEAITKGLTGVDPEKLSAIQTQAQAVAVGLIKPLTGEENRISDRELQIAQRVSRVAADPSAGPEQVVGALKQAIQLNLLVLDREAFQAGEGGIAVGTAVAPDTEGINKFGEQMRRLGFEDEFILDIIELLQNQREAIGLVSGE